MKKLNLDGKNLIREMLKHDRPLYFAAVEGNCCWNQGNVEELKRLEKELIGLEVQLLLMGQFGRVYKAAGVYEGVRNISNGYRRAGELVTDVDLVDYWTLALGIEHEGLVRLHCDGAALPADTPGDVLRMVREELPGYKVEYIKVLKRWSVCGASMMDAIVLDVRVLPLSREEVEEKKLPIYPEEGYEGETMEWYSVRINEKAIQVIDDAKMKRTIQRANEMIFEKKRKKLFKGKSSVFCEVEIGGDTGFERGHIPDVYTILHSMTIKCGDEWLGTTNQEKMWIVDLEKARNRGWKHIKITLPEKERGRFIGKGGQNIRRLEKEIGIPIKVLRSRK